MSFSPSRPCLYTSITLTTSRDGVVGMGVATGVGAGVGVGSAPAAFTCLADATIATSTTINRKILSTVFEHLWARRRVAIDDLFSLQDRERECVCVNPLSRLLTRRLRN